MLLVDNYVMQKYLKVWFINVFGGLLVGIGAVFILLPGPAFLFLPIGFAILSVEHAWANVWLKRCQRWMREGAVKLDLLVSRLKYKWSKR